MQQFIEEFMQKYQSLLENPDFQQQASHGFNQWLHHWPTTTENCAREIAFQKENMTVYRYLPLPNIRLQGIPLLIVYAMINRPTILDLHPNRSLIRALLNHGIPIYVVDWGNPTEKDQENCLELYLEHYLAPAIQQLCRHHRRRKIVLSGICQGGVLSLCYAALYPKKVAKLMPIVTPVDFHTTDAWLSPWLQQIDIALLQHKTGNIPGLWLSQWLQQLRPFRHWQPKYLRLLAQPNASKEEWEFFWLMERWINDCPDHPGRALVEFIQHFYRNNALVHKTYYCGKRQVDLANLTMPILNIYAAKDHLVSPNSAQALEKYVRSKNYQSFRFTGGHIGTLVSHKALAVLPNKIAAWIRN